MYRYIIKDYASNIVFESNTYSLEDAAYIAGLDHLEAIEAINDDFYKMHVEEIN